MTRKILSELNNIYLNNDDVVQKVIQTVRYIKKNSDNLTILKYLYKNYKSYDLAFLTYLLMTMEENAITGIHYVNGKEYSNSGLYVIVKLI